MRQRFSNTSASTSSCFPRLEDTKLIDLWVCSGERTIPRTSNNNCLPGKVVGNADGMAELETASSERILIRTDRQLAPGVQAELFIRPESIILEPAQELPDLNRLKVVVSSILFDGANSQLLVESRASNDELLISLPQNRQYEHISVRDRIEIGWDVRAGNCFPIQ